MPKILDYSEEIDFLEAEIIEDDDDAPVGELVVRVDSNAEQQNEVTAEPVVEVVDEPAVEEIPAPVEEIPIQVEEPMIAVETVEEPVAEVQPIEEQVEETPVAEPVQEEKVEAKEEPKANNVFDAFSSTQAEISGSSFDMPEEPKKKAPAKKTAKPKATEQDVWGTAVINVKKDKKAEPVKEESEKVEEPAKTPQKKTTKKSTKENKTMITEEENIVAKAVDKEATKKAPAKEEKAPAKATKATKETEAPVEKAPAKKAAAKEEVKETVIVEGEGKMHGKYVIKKTDKGFFVFKLFSSNHRVVAIGSQAYKDLKSCKGGIQSVINNAEKAPVENQTLKSYEEQKCPKWVIYQDKKGEYRLRLIASNGNIVATTNDGYVDVSGAKNGIAAVARASKGCAIVRNDDLW